MYHSQMAYAGFWRRLVAYLIDGVILGLIETVLYLIISVSYPAARPALPASAGVQSATELSPEATVATLVVTVLVPFLYFTLLESSHTQATFGKMALGIYVTDTRGEQITYATAVLRYIGKFLSGLICYIGYLMVAFTGRKQGLHDMIAGTVVLRAGHEGAQAPQQARGYSQDPGLEQHSDYWDGTQWIKRGGGPPA